MKEKKIKVKFEGSAGLELETTLNLIKKHDMDYDPDDFGEFVVYMDAGRLEQCVQLEPTSFFTETRLYEYSSGSFIEFESNYKVPKKDQKKIHQYGESDEHFPYVSSWDCYYDVNGNQTFDKEIIKKIKKDYDKYWDPMLGGSSHCQNGLSIQRLDPSDFIKPTDYYW